MGIEVKLSKAQQRAYDKLTDYWQSAYGLQERIKTLDILVDKKLAFSHAKLSSRFFSDLKSNILYKRR
jgi:hypothetical protein